ncbi:hypothetical protein [Pseudochelatococcus contaminans]|uniref:Uncharacterized protein n=1 Tax=Pseudochelatococcus contaminans TaxID=1538103 RepID=A0A7W5Z776_9HYPH|nr:hypothetical protein [Pseudochelatococcus contaminans]MBB3811451.1 hypothetical protein [Pseudochelatococcus contaminans]
MAVPVRSTRASVVHHAPAPDPGALPEIYTIRIHFDKLEPYMRDGEMHVFSTVEPFKKGDIVGPIKIDRQMMPRDYPVSR